VATVAAFRGLLYSASRVPDLQPVVAPPYDVIAPEEAEQYRSRDAHNIVHVDLPRGEAPAKYAQAARLLSQWQQEGVMERDTAPVIYVTSQRYTVRGMPERTRWGFMALLRIEADEAGVVLPHERTMDAPRLDRLELAEATRAQLSPVFVVYTDPGGTVSQTVQAATHRPADRWVVDDAGVQTSLWRVRDQKAIQPILDGLKSHKIWIADGHHRYAASRELRDRMRAKEPGAAPGTRSYDFLLAYFSDVDAPGLTILPYHRVLKGLKRLDAGALVRRVSGDFETKRFAFDGLSHRAEQVRRRLHEVADRGRVALALYAGGTEFILMLLREQPKVMAAMQDLPEPLQRLDISALHRGVLESAMGITPEAQRAVGFLRYTEDAERAIDWVDAGEGQAAFLLNPPVKEILMSVAEAGLQMPQKSTFFYPKVLTGLVLNPLDPTDEVFAR